MERGTVPRRRIPVAKVTMPQLGESVAEGTIGRWLKKPGDRVEKYEPLVEVITDKVNAEVPSPFAGTLTAILAEEGATVPNEAPIAEIETEGAEGVEVPPAAAAAEAAAATPAAASPIAAPAQPQARVDVTSPPVPGVADQVPTAAMATRLPAVGDADARMTPAVRRLLREHGLSAEQVPGTGGGGRITREDVLLVVEAIRTGAPVAFAPGAAAPAAPASAAAAAPALPALGRPAPGAPAGSPVVFPDGADEVLVPMTQMRKGIAAQMTRALQVPHAYVHVEVDATNLVRLRESLKRDYQAREALSLSFVPFVMKAAVEALKRNPTFNATWTEQGLVARRRINMGVAVAVDDGLIVPVVRDVDQLSINGINRAIADVAARARAKRLRVDDFGGGTFTVDNTGWFGSNLTMPIINVPEVAILTMEAITKRAVVVETPQGDVIAIRPVMNMVIGIDHRANDGAQAGYFLRDVKAWLEGVGPDTAVY
jgi:2-oxoisovalerate dehydrogenase E2 component (dihydrolipoyl transacylase)